MSAVVKTRQGELRGSLVDGVHTFKGIRFAAPPFAANHLRPPAPPEAWSGVRDALAFGPTPPYPGFPDSMEVADLLPPESAERGEDCLSLNVWSPELGRAKRPVMVWIAGGLFEYHGTGACPWYDGTRFARDGIVCVTINYRVGAEGFLYLGEGNANLGLLDQVAALEWVRDNIDAFGGDPTNVTVFGESAGALSIGVLLAMPRAEGLFRRAILESGSAHHAISIETAKKVAANLVSKLGVEPTRDAVAAVPLARVLEAQAALRGELEMNPDPALWGIEVVSAMLPWQPVIDGTIVPARPIDRIVAGASAGVDIMVGTNADETRLFLVPGGMIDRITKDALAALVMGYGLPVESTLNSYGKAYPGASPGDLFSAIQTDWFWRIPAIRLADAHAKRESRTYMYELAWRSPLLGGRLGACHALEIAFVFDSIGNRTEAFWGPNPPRQLADAMHRAWVGFATNGDPGWPRYDLERRATMRFDETSTLVNDPRAAERALWQGVR